MTASIFERRRIPTGKSGVVRVALYLRVSTRDQLLGYGIDVQEDGCTEYVGRKAGWQIADRYIDEGVSGTVTRRPEMLRLERDVRAGLIDVIVVHRYDRVGRSGRAFWAWVWAMEDLGVQFVSVTQDLDTTTPTGQLMRQQFASYAEFEHAMILERTNSGRQAKALVGGWPGGRVPYGYELEGKGTKASKLAICEEEAAVLRAAVSAIVDNGLSIAETAELLNVAGHRTRSGKSWLPSALWVRLHSDTLDGYVIFRKPHTTKAKNKTKMDKDGQPLYGDTVYIPAPLIFSEERVAQLRTAMARRAITTSGERHDYPLTGRIKGSCGAGYVGHYVAKDQTRYYRCSGRRQNGCIDSAIDATAAENEVWKQIADLLQTPSIIRNLIASWTENLPGTLDIYQSRVKELEQQAQEKDEEIVNLLIESARLGAAAEHVEKANARLKQELDEINALLSYARELCREHELIATRQRDVVALADSLAERLSDPTPRERAELFELLDIHVVSEEPTFRKREGNTCETMRWHIETKTPVPNPMSEAAWDVAYRIIRERSATGRVPVPKRLRAALNGMFYRLRTGIFWSDLPAEYGKGDAVRVRQEKLRSDGTWPLLVEALLAIDGGVPAFEPPRIPALRIRGYLSTELEPTDEEALEQGERDSSLALGDEPVLRVFSQGSQRNRGTAGP
jgi:DNA invertase Pin-like site-specific DNA recombinase